MAPEADGIEFSSYYCLEEASTGNHLQHSCNFLQPACLRRFAASLTNNSMLSLTSLKYRGVDDQVRSHRFDFLTWIRLARSLRTN